ncbi:MAG: S41 family peptidase [bacterium]|nr:S41 family peptidase [bacterium]
MIKYIVFIIAAAVLLCSAPSFADKASKPPAKSEKNSDLIDYSDYVKNPSKLGFSPNLSLFKSAYNLIKMKYLEPTDDAVLAKGVKKEVNRLMRTAGKPASFNLQSLNDVSQQVKAASSSSGLSEDLVWLAAIEGLLSAMDDPYTVLLTPKDYKSLMEQMQAGSFGGIGVFIQQDKDNGNQLTVFEPMEGTPAYKAGILPEDLIMYINGESTKNMPIDVAMAKLRGEPGTQVSLKIKRKTSSKLIPFTLVREQIRVKSVGCKLIDKSIGYIKIRTFGDDTASEFAKALAALESRNIKGLIIDVRNNGGGLINAAVDLCSHFVPSGQPIVSVVTKSGDKQYMRSSGGIGVKVPCVVLINKYSASASEITAGCLQDYGFAKLMGGKSYGKGSVQELIPLRNGGGFKITVAHYFTPKNRFINKIGIEPDIKKEMDVTKAGRPGDIQLSAAVNYLKKR